MVGLRPHPVSLVLAALLAGVLLSAPPAAAGGGSGGYRDTAVGPDTGPVDVDWILESALDQRKVEADCPNPDHACCALPGGLDHFANGGAARNTGHTTVRAQSAPPNAVAVRATLFIGVIQPGPPPPPNILISFEGHPLLAGLVGFSADPCWNGAGVFSLYAVNVLPFIPPWINGDYQVAGIPTFRNDGADPWVFLNNTLPLSEGATLVVIYSHASVPAGSIVYTHTGPSTFLGGALNINNALVPAPPATNFLRHTRIGGDGQVGFSITANAAVAGDTTAINAIQIRGPGAPANQDSDWNGHDGVPLNQLWDTQTSDITGTIPAGAANYVVNYFSPADCVSPSVHVLTAF